MSSELLKDSHPLFSVVSKDHSILRHSIYALIPFFDGRLPVVIQVCESDLTSVAGSGKGYARCSCSLHDAYLPDRRSRFLAVAGQRDTNILPPSHNKMLVSLGQVSKQGKVGEARLPSASRKVEAEAAYNNAGVRLKATNTG